MKLHVQLGVADSLWNIAWHVKRPWVYIIRLLSNFISHCFQISYQNFPYCLYWRNLLQTYMSQESDFAMAFISITSFLSIKLSDSTWIATNEKAQQMIYTMYHREKLNHFFYLFFTRSKLSFSISYHQQQCTKKT